MLCPADKCRVAWAALQEQRDAEALFHLQIAGQGRAGRVKWRSVNAPLAYLMGGMRMVGSEGWGFFHVSY